MRRLVVFQQMSLDGYFVDQHDDMSWAKDDGDAEFDAFSSENASNGGVLVFGRVTYELMASFWPTRQAREALPVVAERMNALPKVVFSRTLDRASWNNTTVLHGDPATELRRMKREPGEGMAILGSGSLVAQLALERLIDEYQIVVSPIALGRGRTMFDGLERRLSLRLTASRTFRGGKVFLSYEPAA
jgi:dihydrofolate reductase